MSCKDCVFRGTFQDMGASCDVCNLQSGLADAIEACENSDRCRFRFTVQEAKKIVIEREGTMPVIVQKKTEQSAQIEQSDPQIAKKDAVARVAEAAQKALDAMKMAVAGIRVSEETIKHFDQMVKESAGDHEREREKRRIHKRL